jgi:anthranilate phosphoribosyltransferase
MYSSDTTARLDYFRGLAQQRDLTAEESREVIALIRQDRVTASTVSAASKAKKAPVDGSAVLAKLMAAMGKGGPA